MGIIFRYIGISKKYTHHYCKIVTDVKVKNTFIMQSNALHRF